MIVQPCIAPRWDGENHGQLVGSDLDRWCVLFCFSRNDYLIKWHQSMTGNRRAKFPMNIGKRCRQCFVLEIQIRFDERISVRENVLSSENSGEEKKSKPHSVLCLTYFIIFIFYFDFEGRRRRRDNTMKEIKARSCRRRSIKNGRERGRGRERERQGGKVRKTRRKKEKRKRSRQQGRQVYAMNRRLLVVSCCVTGSRGGIGHQIVAG